ncbi:MAG TPA: crossover junction endodeoxyribonuclease RuvC [Trueperaceae bacterium]|nr:crossover junction endodeoxyribonuclease RuvC [Trueperaceae bacterium]
MPGSSRSQGHAEPFRVVGVDPGIANLGLGAVEERGHDARLLGSEVVRTPARQPQADRLLALKRATGDFLDAHRPHALAIEGQFFHQQRDVSFKVGQAFGVVLLAAAERGIPVFEYGPMQVKQALVGSGRAHKDQVIYMVRALLGMTRAPTDHHASDALALALTHLSSRRLGAPPAGRDG